MSSAVPLPKAAFPTESSRLYQVQGPAREGPAIDLVLRSASAIECAVEGRE